MANSKQHSETGQFIGIALGLFFNLTKQRKRSRLNSSSTFNWNEFIVCGIGGGVIGNISGILPDIFEPALHPNHRRGFHSLTAGLIVMVGMKESNKMKISDEAKAAINISCASYLSHLWLDSQTPKALPFI